jgi:hypothetical protein
MSWLAAILIVGTGVALLGALFERQRAQGRARSAAFPGRGNAALRTARGVRARLLTDAALPGLRADVAHRLLVDLVLAAEGFRVGSHLGCLLATSADQKVVARCVGPRRLVVEGVHPSGRARLRLELAIDEPEVWAAALVGAAPTGSSLRSPGL